MSSKELILLLLYAPLQNGRVNAAIRGRTRLEKMMFLFQKEIWQDFKFDKLISEDVLPQFIAWRFGPFSKDVYSDIDFLSNVGLIEIEGSEEPAAAEEALELSHWSGSTWGSDLPVTESVKEFSEESFRLTDQGTRYVEEKCLWESLSDDQRGALSSFKDRLSRAPLYAILRYVYDKYPDTTVRSEIRDKVLGSGS